MPMVKRCCCLRNLRTGSIVCGIWTLIWCVMTLALNISELEKCYNNPDEYILEMYRDTTALLVLIWVNLCVSFLTFISSLIVIAGILQDNQIMLIPWMVMVLVLVMVDAASIICNIILLGFTKLLIFFFLLWIVTTLINIYCELCVLSHYQELKAGRGRPTDYISDSGAVRYVPAVQHVHFGDTPMNLYSQHTVYSFHSQTLCEGEEKKPIGSVPNGEAGTAKAPGAISNGIVYKLRPVTSLPADMNARYTGNNYTGSIEMKIVDSMPVIVDGTAMYDANNYTGSLDMGNGAPPKKSRRIRTVSESAVKRLTIEEKNSGSTSSLKNIADSNANHRTSVSKKESYKGGRATTFSLGSSLINKDPECAPLSQYLEEDD